MTPTQQNPLQLAAWQRRADLKAVVLVEIEQQEAYRFANVVYREPGKIVTTWRRVPAAVKVFLTAVVVAALIICF